MFVQKMEVYCHAGHEDVENASQYKIAYKLMDGYKNKNCIVTCDNFNFNFTLFWELLKVGVHAIETCRLDHKGWPRALTIDPKRRSRKRLWYRMHASSKIVVVSWFDNKPISILSITISPINPLDATFANKPISILSITFSPINPLGATFASRGHLIGPLEIPTNPILVDY
jgi:hypothetical protein